MTDTENLPPRRSTRLRSGTTTTNPLDTKQPTGLGVSPLRIAKSNSRSKQLSSMIEDTTLKDISPGSSRRNSPSTFQIKEKLAQLQTNVNKSPPTSPPLGMVKSDSASSVRTFWQNATTSTPEESGHKRQGGRAEEEVKNIRASFVKNNIFVAKDLKEREGSPKLTMSPSQHRLSAQFEQTVASTTTVNSTTAVASSPSKIPAPVDASQSSRKDIRPPTATDSPKASCLHSTRIKGPRQNVNTSDDSDESPGTGRRERRKTVTFDEAPQVLQFDRRSSHGTTSSERSYAPSEDDDHKRGDSIHVSHPFEESTSRPLPSIPSRPLPQVPPHQFIEDRPTSKDSNESDYGDMEDRIRSMMERVVLRDSVEPKKEDPSDQEDIFSLYTTINDMEEDSQESAVFSSQATDSTALSSQVASQDDELERQLALQKQSEELLKAVASRPFSLAELPDLGFGDDADEDMGGGLGLGEYCSPDPIPSPRKKEIPTSPAASLNTQVFNLGIVEKPTPNLPEPPSDSQPPAEKESFTPPITPPLPSTELALPETPKDQILPAPDTLPSTPPASPTKHTEEEDHVPSPVVPEREATIRSRGGSKLRVRPSLSRQEAESIVARRRKSEIPPLPNLNDIREASVDVEEVKIKQEEEDDLCEFGGKMTIPKIDMPLLKIDALGFENDRKGSGFGEMAVEEMERVIEAQKVYFLNIELTVAWVYDETTFEGCSCK
jgi:hypothetical protein